MPLPDSDHDIMVDDAPVEDVWRPPQLEASEPPQQQGTQENDAEADENAEEVAQAEIVVEQLRAEDHVPATQAEDEQAADQDGPQAHHVSAAQVNDAQAAGQFDGARAAEAVAPPRRARRGRAVQARVHPYAARGPMDERKIAQRRIAADRGWVAFLEPPAVTVLASGRQRIQRQAARVSQARTRYIANALRPNLTD